MLIYMSLLTILPKMKKFHHTVSEKLSLQSVTDRQTEGQIITMPLCHGAAENNKIGY
jgi:hypothetical protein